MMRWIAQIIQWVQGRYNKQKPLKHISPRWNFDFQICRYDHTERFFFESYFKWTQVMTICCQTSYIAMTVFDFALFWTLFKFSEFFPLDVDDRHASNERSFFCWVRIDLSTHRISMKWKKLRGKNRFKIKLRGKNQFKIKLREKNRFKFEEHGRLILWMKSWFKSLNFSFLRELWRSDSTNLQNTINSLFIQNSKYFKHLKTFRKIEWFRIWIFIENSFSA